MFVCVCVLSCPVLSSYLNPIAEIMIILSDTKCITGKNNSTHVRPFPHEIRGM